MGVDGPAPAASVRKRWDPATRRIAALAGAWFAVAAVLTLLGFADGELVCDDAYYYFEIARNAALGQGFTFDSLHPTNGFHPLWAWTLVPLFYLFPHSVWAPIRLSLILAAALTAGTALCIHAFFSRNRRPTAGLIGAAVWLLNPFTIVLAFRGLEGPLNTLLIAASFLYLDGMRRRAGYADAEFVRLGLLAGLCLLARTDNVLLVASLSLVLAIDLLRRGAWRAGPRKGALFLATAAAVTLPWCAWNLATFGTVVQTSFRSKQMFDLYGQLPEWIPSGSSGPAAIAQAVGGALHNLVLVAEYNAKHIVGEQWTPIRQGYWMLYALLFLGVGLAALPHAHRRLRALYRDRPGGPGGSLGPVGVFCLFHFGWYALVGRNYYNWYFLPPVFAFCLFLGSRLGWLWSIPARPARALVAAVILALVGTMPPIVARHVSALVPFADERAYLAQMRPRIDPTPSGSRLGIWNAGAAGYFSSFHYPDRYVINLDGVVNNQVPQRAALEGGYEQYLLDSVDYLIELPGQMERMVGEKRTRAFVAQHLTPSFRIVAAPGPGPRSRLDPARPLRPAAQAGD